jgi:hypothetical protein
VNGGIARDFSALRVGDVCGVVGLVGLRVPLAGGASSSDEEDDEEDALCLRGRPRRRVGVSARVELIWKSEKKKVKTIEKTRERDFHRQTKKMRTSSKCTVCRQSLRGAN